jgi:hypothetical protein
LFIKITSALDTVKNRYMITATNAFFTINLIKVIGYMAIFINYFIPGLLANMKYNK